MADDKAGFTDLNATLEAERTRIVRSLRDLADRIERAPLERVSQGLGVVAGFAEQLIRRVEQFLGGGRGGSRS